MQIIDLSKQNTIINQYMAEMRDRDYQQNRLLFRNNITRVGEMMAYEISKTLAYEPRDDSARHGARQRAHGQGDTGHYIPSGAALPQRFPARVRPCGQRLRKRIPRV